MSRSRLLRCVAALTLAGACRSPLGGEDIDLSIAASGLPAFGASAGLAQRIGSVHGLRLDAELAWTHQELPDEGPRGDDWDQVFGGVRLGDPANAELRRSLRAGITWLRAEGDPQFLDDPGDYGGVYLGGGLTWRIARSLSSGPELTLSALDSEGSKSGSGFTAELAWRLVWHL